MNLAEVHCFSNILQHCEIQQTPIFASVGFTLFWGLLRFTVNYYNCMLRHFLPLERY